MEPFTAMAARTSTLGANRVVVSTTPFVLMVAMVHWLVVETAPAPGANA